MRILIFTITLFCFSGWISTGAVAENEEPSYAKWGNIAVTETIKKYPNEKVVDYLHIGRVDKTATLAVEKFKLWLRGSKREFGVYVYVEFDKQTNQFKAISFQETDR